MDCLSARVHCKMVLSLTAVLIVDNHLSSLLELGKLSKAGTKDFSGEFSVIYLWIFVLCHIILSHVFL